MTILPETFNKIPATKIKNFLEFKNVYLTRTDVLS